MAKGAILCEKRIKDSQIYKTVSFTTIVKGLRKPLNTGAKHFLLDA